MKKILKMLVCCSSVLLGAASLASCSSSGAKFKIGICNYVDDASLNQIVENIENTLKSYNKNETPEFEIITQNCMADATVLNQIISDFESKDVDLMVGVATPVAMAMQSATEDSKTPVVFAAVSDPLACNLVDSLEKPGANITGTSDYLDTNKVFDLIFAQNPSASKIGLLYDQGQDSSTTSIAVAKEYLKKKGISYVERTGTNTQEVTQAVNQLISDKVDAIFTPSDNTIMTAELSIYESIAAAKIPHYAGADSFALNGAFCGYGVDYAALGVDTANMVYDILENKKDISTYSVKTYDSGTATINTETCAKLGYSYADIEAKFKPLTQGIKTTITKESF